MYRTTICALAAALAVGAAGCNSDTPQAEAEEAAEEQIEAVEEAAELGDDYRDVHEEYREARQEQDEASRALREQVRDSLGLPGDTIRSRNP